MSGSETYTTSQGFRVKRLQPAIGAELFGVDLAADMSAAVVQDLREALLAHGVIFLRGQDITYERHVELGEAFGELILDGSDPVRPAITPVRAAAGATNQSASRWHSDGCFKAIPPSISILRAIDVNPFGGDTCFSSAVAAYEGLSEEMKARIANLRYTADMAYMLRRAGARSKAFGTEENDRRLVAKYPPVDQPVVRAHPETGKPVLYCNDAQSIGIVGMDEAEGRDLLETLFDEFRRPEYQVRWSWENHSIAIWDNRAVQHYGVPNPQYDRYLERVTVMGTRPLGLEEWKRAKVPVSA